MTLSVSDTDRTQKPHKSRSPEMFLKSLLFGKVCAVPPFFLSCGADCIGWKLLLLPPPLPSLHGAAATLDHLARSGSL